MIAGLLQGSLQEVEALQEVKAELEGKTTLLYTRLLEDLTSQVRLLDPHTFFFADPDPCVIGIKDPDPG